MTTRRLSSRRDYPAKSANLLDAQGRPVQLAGWIGKGGEGSVYEVEGEPALVVKVYHRLPLPEDQRAKLQAMVSHWSKDLEAISAWPRSIVYDAGRRMPCGILMPKVADARHLHELYGTSTRRRHFPGALWQHLVLAARNAAAAFYTLHTAGIVVGDVNQGNLMVDPQMRVRLIDCDSFQITHEGKTFTCPVGTPHFTPPELRGEKLREVQRTSDHDAFGLAVLIFHLLFVGRHPFAGRYRGAGDLPITKAIAERRFAFSKERCETLVDPPPASLRLEDLPPEVARLFEAAFRGGGDGRTSRPTPEDWARKLEDLMKQRKTCTFDRLHIYCQRLDECPWCRIEDEGGPTFFVPSDGASFISADRLAHLDRRVDELRPVRFPSLTAHRVDPPRMPPLKRLAKAGPWTSADTGAGLMAAAAVASLAGIAFPLALAVGAALAMAGGGLLLAKQEAKARRDRVTQSVAKLEQLRGRMLKLAPGILGGHQQRKRLFDRAASHLRTAVEHYRAEGAELQDVLAQQCEIQKSEFLRSHLIRDHIRQIPGLKGSMVAMLESFGVESALEIDSLNLCAVPNLDPHLTVELAQWRSLLESEFVFEPDHGITFQDLQVARDAATRRFKLSQARKVLMGAKQVEALAQAGEGELKRALARFDALVSEWRDLAMQLRDFQSSRHWLERTINRAPGVIVAFTIGIPLVGALLHLLFG
jgi:DNA-binding helix-hairpin-helix protein with protein kinase domain